MSCSCCSPFLLLYPNETVSFRTYDDCRLGRVAVEELTTDDDQAEVLLQSFSCEGIQLKVLSLCFCAVVSVGISQ